MVGWLEYGAALNEGRRLFASDNFYHEWLSVHQLVGPNDMERAAAMWAAEDSARFFTARLAHPSVRTVRGLHAKWKEARDQARPEQSAEPAKAPDMGPSLADLRSVVKLRAVINHPNSGAPERAAALWKETEGVRIFCRKNLRPSDRY